ncbi:uncharacterized protein LOC110714207 [Chenopodium quinoa]|uniref:DUF4378 domain-containing protein n=1 Tax=Chenopodium quinoa TaxID=63459 RepID=A0A803KZA0_CHEQI|nr:uncharacterized protein LOC110714207 [Chenopodium quinoa]
MAKGSRKKVARYQKDQSGCMWGLISIFDFRHGRSSQKLLVDKKRGSRRLDGTAYANINLETLTDSCEICNDNEGSVQCETAASDISKLSVKELMEEEMLGEQDQKIANGEAKLNTTGDGGNVKKNRRWMRNKMSLDLDASGFVAAEDLKAERPSHRKNKSCGSVDLNVIVEELCNRIHQKGTSCQKHGQDRECTIQSTEDPSVIERKLWESTKVLVNHFTDGNSSGKDGKIQPSKELTDALQILNSHKDLFLKLLQDPNSQLVKHIQSSQDIEVEEGKFKVLTGSDMLQQDIGNAKQQNFWRRFKGLERNSSRKTDTSEDINRIVVLKPGPPSSNNSETASLCSSLPGSPQTKGDKGQFERSYSPFSFSEFKRKLKHAMRKEQHRLSHQPSDDHPTLANQEKKFSGELIGMASPSRDHFFIEKIPKTSVGKTGKLKDDSALTPEQRVSNIYIEARKHLAEIVGNGDIDADIPNKKGPRSLGKILAYSGYSSPICSPRTEGGMKSPPNGECQTGDEKSSQITQTSYVSHPAQVKEESQNELCIAVDKPVHEADVSIIETLTIEGLPHERNNDEPTCETEALTSEVPVVSVRSPDAQSPKESDAKEISTEQFSPSPIKKNDQEDSSCSTCSDKNLHPTILKEDLCEENKPSSSSNASPLICKLTENDEDLDTASDATSRQSPISVLDPLFQEDDISPPGNKYSNEPIRPRQIRFGEEISAPLERVLSCRTCVHDDKYTIEFVKAVVQMSGLSWEELLQRSILSDHLVDPSLLDEVDFLPDLLSCDFNVLFDLINEVLIEICCLNFGCLLSLTMPYVQPELKGKDIFTEIWKRVDWYLKLEGPPRTLDQIVEKDLEKPGKWLDLQLDCQCIGIRIQEAILEELVQETILSFDTAGLESESSVIQQAVAKDIDIDVEV